MHAIDFGDSKNPPQFPVLMARSSTWRAIGSSRLHFLRLIAENKREPVFARHWAIRFLDSAVGTR
jgi:hypothetical protein